jgi:hypothetical protein
MTNIVAARFFQWLLASVLMCSPAFAAQEAKPLRTIQDCVRLVESLRPFVLNKETTNVANVISPHYLEKMDPAKVSAGMEKVRVAFESVAGKITGWERVSVRQLGSSVLFVRFFEKHEAGVMVWTFRFYRPRDQWGIEGAGMLGKEIEELPAITDSSEWVTPKVE